MRFDQRQGSSDGGAILLKAAERRYGLIGGLARCLEDKRQAGKIDHSLHELLAQRVFSIACGYPDANDCALSPRTWRRDLESGGHRHAGGRCRKVSLREK